MFLASLSFFVTFAIARVITHAFRAGVINITGPRLGETHVHHLVWGILLLLFVGYLALIQMSDGASNAARGLALLYGVGAALTLDEFALWLNLEDVYWEREGRSSIDAVVLFGALISVGLWGKPFFRGVVRQLGRLFRRRGSGATPDGVAPSPRRPPAS